MIITAFMLPRSFAHTHIFSVSVMAADSGHVPQSTGSLHVLRVTHNLPRTPRDCAVQATAQSDWPPAPLISSLTCCSRASRSFARAGLLFRRD